MARTIACLDIQFPSLIDHPELPDLVSLALDDLSPAAIHEAGQDLAPTWRVFLADQTGVAAAARQLAGRFDDRGLRIAVAEVDDEDWAARSQAHLTRVIVGEITVAPPWDAAPPAFGTLVVVHPSTGFGTGHHQTTRLCLGFLQQLDLTGRRVVDLGTGSGVLALCAWRRGATDVEALDHDEDAIVNAQENLRLNGAESAIVLRRADVRDEPIEPADVVTANLTGALLVALAPAITTLVRPGGTLILSGILEAEAAAVTDSFAHELTLVQEAAEDEWRALRFLRP